MKGAVFATAVAASLLQMPVASMQADLRADTTSQPFLARVASRDAFIANRDTHLAHAQTLLDQLIAVKGRRTIDNTLRVYDDLLIELSLAQAGANIFSRLLADKAFRETARETLERVASFQAALTLNPAVYRALSEIDLERADPETRHYVARELKAAKLAGVDRDEATRARLQKLREQLTVAMAVFDKNARDKKTVSTPRSALDGLPADFISRLAPAADGMVTLSSNVTEARPVLTYAKSDDLRRQMYLALQTVGYPQNHAALTRMLELRAEIAREAGYANWAEYDMASRMTGTAAAASAFIDSIVAASEAKAAREYEALLARKRQDVPAADRVMAWESFYYTELVRRASYDFDSQRLRPYFPMARVKPGVLELASRLFGVSYRPAKDASVWHPSVEAFELVEDGQVRGRFYLDLHARADKEGGNPLTAVIRRGVGGRQLPEVALMASFPGDKPGDPGLLTHDDVKNFFHEFGHVVHNLLGGHRRWYGTSGTPSERDFIETQSQMLEEWTYDAPTLATFAKHYQTNEPIPGELVAQLRRAAVFGQGLAVRGQMMMATLSLSLHERDPRTADPDAILRDFQSRFMPYQYPDGIHPETGFTQLANTNYGAAYYTYMWSSVIAKDLFARFDRTNLLSAPVARRFRETLLAPAGSKPAATLVSDFLGRPFNSRAWEAWLNGNWELGIRN
jgi:thimet oligopeptidase